MDEFWHGTRLGITCAPVRQLLIDYLHEHQLRSDHASIRGLAYTLGTLFWRDLENPRAGISSIKLTPAAAARWKQRVQVKTTTAPAGSGGTITVQSRRSTAPNILLQVRAFYLDLAQWAADDPSRWGPWAVPCPIRDEIWYHKEASRRKARMDQRTGERLPVLPALVAAVDREREPAAALLAAAQAVRPGQLFTAGTETFRRSVTTKRRIVRIWCEPPAGGPRTDLPLAEHQAFWTWAAVEVLRHTGMFSGGHPLWRCAAATPRPGWRLPPRASGIRRHPGRRGCPGVLAASLFGDVVAALREHVSATLDEHCCYFRRPD